MLIGIFCLCVFLFFLVRIMFGIFHKRSNQSQKQIKGTVVLMPKNVLDVDALTSIRKAGFLGIFSDLWNLVCDVAGLVEDTVTAFFGRSIAIELISATRTVAHANHGKVGKRTYVDNYLPSLGTLGASHETYYVYFDYEADFGTPGAFYIKNSTHEEFFLVSLTLEDIPNHGTIHFVCNSWIYKTKFGEKNRIFFTNDAYLRGQTPSPLLYYRTVELETLRGDGTGERKWHERIYDYDVYNDLGDPDSDASLSRPTLGGSLEYLYPRRVRTGRKSTRTESTSEKPAVEMYVPRDENFGHLKSSDFLAYGLKSLCQDVLPLFKSMFYGHEFENFDDVDELYDGGIQLPTEMLIHIRPLPFHKEIHHTENESFLRFPRPGVIQEKKLAWMTDDEFGREMIAGVNPNVIRLLQEFPPKSKLDVNVYGDQTSNITTKDLEGNLDGLTVNEALSGKRLFILDYHDAYMPFLERINKIDGAKAYATRTILFLKDDGTLKPLVIELSKPHDESKVILPADKGVESTIWLLAKAYVTVNDSGYHQLISHWLNTHASMEPFVIATNRHLSTLHPIYKLLHPHYRDTININSLARQALINAGGIIEQSFLPGQYSMEISSVAYRDWVFTDQALPADLIKRGMAVEDPSASHGLRLAVEDYPYAVDGLEIWDAIKNWVQDYVSLYYPTDDAVQKDSELQAWWKEVVQRGHADLKDKPWWPKMQTIEELVQSCSIIIWTSSALHAAVNFGQYPYGGYILNRPTLSRRFIPEKGTPEYDKMAENREKSYLRTITPLYQTLVDLSVIAILSRHASDEVYLGTRDSPNWTSDTRAVKAFEKFRSELEEIAEKIEERNKDSRLKNRTGPVKLPYTLLLRSSEEGLTFRGIPNSISI